MATADDVFVIVLHSPASQPTPAPGSLFGHASKLGIPTLVSPTVFQLLLLFLNPRAQDLEAPDLGLGLREERWSPEDRREMPKHRGSRKAGAGVMRERAQEHSGDETQETECAWPEKEVTEQESQGRSRSQA